MSLFVNNGFLVNLILSLPPPLVFDILYIEKCGPWVRPYVLCGPPVGCSLPALIYTIQSRKLRTD